MIGGYRWFNGALPLPEVDQCDASDPSFGSS